MEILRNCVLLFYIPSILSQNVFHIHSENSFNLSRRILELTGPIAALKMGRLSPEEFAANLRLRANEEQILQPDNSLLSITGLYNLGCSVYEWCGEEVTGVVKLVRDAVETKMDITLILAMEFDITNGTNYEREKEFDVKVANIDFVFLLELPQLTNCHEILQAGGTNLNNVLKANSWVFGQVVGIGYSENLIGCPKLAYIMEFFYFTVIYTNFGNTVGVPESFGIFRRQINNLHERNEMFLKDIPVLSQAIVKGRQTVYFVTEQNVGDNQYQSLLSTFGKRWLTEENRNIGFIMPQITRIKEETKSNQQKFKLVPFLSTSDIYDWTAPAILLEVASHFNSIVLTHNQWNELLHNIGSEESPFSTTKPKIDFKMEMILDCSSTMANEHTIHEWKPVVNNPTGNDQTTDFGSVITALLPTLFSFAGSGSHQLTSLVTLLRPLFEKNVAIISGYKSSPIQNVTLKALVFKLIPRKNKYVVKVDVDFAHKISKEFVVGCNISVSDNLSLDDVVEVCKGINASMYVLQSKIELDYDRLNSSHYYANNVRTKLEEAKMFRNEILDRHPNAEVLLQVDINSNFRKEQNNTVFCNPAVYMFNEYNEAILNWGKLSHFTLILKSATDDLSNPAPSTTSWLNYLRPVGGESMMMAELPSFVLRNYPEKINNWEVDPCIDWIFGRPDEVRNANYFHDGILGSILRNGKGQGGQEIFNAEDLEMMLQFNLHKFQSTEIIVKNSSHNVMSALKNLEAKRLLEKNRNIFISYTFTSTKEAMDFLHLIKGLQLKPLKFIAGVHIEFPSMTMILQALAGKLNANEAIQGFKIMRKPSAPKLNFNLGLQMSSENCLYFYSGSTFEVMRKFFTDSGITKYLSYLVCSEKLTLSGQDDIKSLGHVFDAHLYTKRGYQNILPHINLHFRVEVEVVLNEDSGIMDRYLRLLYHFKSFGSLYNISYFIVEAFDGDSKERQNGWWKIKDFKNLKYRESYLEKESVYSGRQMWYPPLPGRTETDMRIIAFVVLIAVILIIAGIIVFAVCIRYKKLNKYLSDNEVKEFLQGRSLLVGENENDATDDSLENTKFNSTYELSILDISIDTQKIVGFGNFGTVYKGVAKGKAAAIKKPNRDCTKAVFKSFLCEIKIFCHIGPHSNVVGFIGAYIKEIHKGVLCIATEFCSNGSLEAYLKQIKRDIYEVIGDLPEQESFPQLYDLHRFAGEIAEGMSYIGSRKVVHGDLSTRNVLLNENKTCKIGDFGLSRKLYEYEKYVKKSENDVMPWKWMAYETLTEREFTLKSDVWSYGITIWEIYSLGSTPYGGLAWTPGFADEIKDGLRLSSPHLASDNIYKRMEECWNIDTKQRPMFADLGEFFRSLCRGEYSMV